MVKKKGKGFTLIELIAVLVILAIIALIVTPLVMSIIKKAKISADKRSIDAYGRSIELAIAGYLLDNGSFPTEVSQLTIEYSGDNVTCETTQINSDSSVFLSNCKVNNREVNNYTYGSDKSPSYEAYSVGDEVTYNGVDYYVLKDSDAKDNVVTLLKAEPLSTEEVNLYGGEYVNKYTNNYRGEANDIHGYGAVAYFSSEECTGGQYSMESGCTNNYEESDIKHIADGWSTDKININDLKQIRLITYTDLENLGYEWREVEMNGNIKNRFIKTEVVPTWIWNSNYSYWTMEKSNYNLRDVDVLKRDGEVSSYNGGGTQYVYYTDYVLRPVVELYKNDGITRKS